MATREQQLESLLQRARCILNNMAWERDDSDWLDRLILGRWYIDHEPLRNDAKNLLPLIDQLFQGHD